MTRPAVGAVVVTWDSAATIARCLASLAAQTHPLTRLVVVDNASGDATVAEVERAAAAAGSAGTPPTEILRRDSNTGFCAATNEGIRRCGGDYVLAMNPDAYLAADYIERLVAALEHPGAARAGAATGKLHRWTDPADAAPCLDSTGMYVTPTGRHFDRGAGESDRGRYGHAEWVFGASGAAALYRRAMLDDVAPPTGAGEVGAISQVFDEDFFAYREDADLAWRGHLRGWGAVYVPWAHGWHRRRVTPERRAALPAAINLHGVKNRFLLRIKNATPAHLARFAIPLAARDLIVVAAVVARERTSLPALAWLWRNRDRLAVKRREVQSRRTAAAAEVDRWFRFHPHAEPAAFLEELRPR